jgi:hypothetical protein
MMATKSSLSMPHLYLMAISLLESMDLAGFSGQLSDSGTGWTNLAANNGRRARAALRSRGGADFKRRRPVRRSPTRYGTVHCISTFGRDWAKRGRFMRASDEPNVSSAPGIRTPTITRR